MIVVTIGSRGAPRGGGKDADVDSRSVYRMRLIFAKRHFFQLWHPTALPSSGPRGQTPSTSRSPSPVRPILRRGPEKGQKEDDEDTTERSREITAGEKRLVLLPIALPSVPVSQTRSSATEERDPRLQYIALPRYLQITRLLLTQVFRSTAVRVSSGTEISPYASLFSSTCLLLTPL